MPGLRRPLFQVLLGLREIDTVLPLSPTEPPRARTLPHPEALGPQPCRSWRFKGTERRGRKRTRRGRREQRERNEEGKERTERGK